MGFIRDVAGMAISPLGYAAGLLGKKKSSTPPAVPTMISNTPYSRPMSTQPTSMIGTTRGGF